MPGNEPLRVSAWSIEDVAHWLESLSLSQYTEAFIDAAVDGEFLYDLTDDDLKNTLGVEHRLHRKKILNCVNRLKVAESERDKALSLQMKAGNAGSRMNMPGLQGMVPMGSDANSYLSSSQQIQEQFSIATNDEDGSMQDGNIDEDRRRDMKNQMQAGALNLDDLIPIVRHGKVKKLHDKLKVLPSRPFDASLVRVPYVEDFGTSYVDSYDREIFNMNKTDEHGNSLLIIACQNGHEKVSKYLVEKGANPNHQNKQGQTPGHFAVSYQFYDLSSWLFDPNGGGGDDTIENKFGLTPYDGLDIEEDDDD
jgi:hypothetical protein